MSKWWALSIQSARAEHVLTKNAGHCSPFPWGNVVMSCGITARHFDESMAGVTSQHYSRSDSKNTYWRKCECYATDTKATSTQAKVRCFWPRRPPTHHFWQSGSFGSSGFCCEKKTKVECCVILRALIKETATQYPTWLFTDFIFTVIFWQGNESAVQRLRMSNYSDTVAHNRRIKLASSQVQV